MTTHDRRERLKLDLRHLDRAVFGLFFAAQLVFLFFLFINGGTIICDLTPSGLLLHVTISNSREAIVSHGSYVRNVTHAGHLLGPLRSLRLLLIFVAIILLLPARSINAVDSAAAACEAQR